MSFRPVIISSAKKIYVENNNLTTLSREDVKISIPLEDILIVLIEDPYTLITTRLISRLCDYGIAIIICDDSYLPNAITKPLNTHYNGFGIFKMQMGIQEELKTLLWTEIIKQKIINQKLVMERTSNIKKDIDMLNEYIPNITLGDMDNKEGISAKIFFTSLYGGDFLRFSNNAISQALNYGYSILHSAIVRELTALGFTTMLGIWHKSESNNFNLASDIIEAYRPIVDYFVYWNMDRLTTPLSFEVRTELVRSLLRNIEIDGKIYRVSNAIEITCKSLVKVYETLNPKYLKLPRIIENFMLNEELL